MLKIVIGTNEGKVLCISNNEDEIKASMVNYLIDTDQEPTEDFFESRNWGEYDIEVYDYHQPQLNENQQIVLGQLKINAGSNGSLIKAIHSLFNLLTISSNQLEKDCTEGLLKSKNALARLTRKQAAEVLSAFAQ